MTLMLVGGGTGGHVFPAVAVAEAWLAAGLGDVVFVGSPRGLEARVVPERGWPFVPFEARRLKNAGLLERGRSLLRAPASVLAGMRLVRELDPQVVLGVGGYVSGPVVLAAALLGRPCAVAEQNARPGLTNRILGRFVRRIYTAFPEAAERLPGAKVRELGNPVRAAIRAAEPPSTADGVQLLVLGGSQGARALNEMVPPAFAALRERFPTLRIRHQAGKGNGEAVRAAYEAAGVGDADVTEFIEDVADAMRAAQLVVARAGATTVAELACIGRPAFFVPFPHAADDHQAANAASLVDAGAARMARESELDAERLAAHLAALLEEPETLRAMAERARGRGRPGAAEAIVDDLFDLAGGDS